MENVILGSGDLYIAEYDEEAGIPADAEIEKEENKVGHIQGGAEVEYKPTLKEVKDDMGAVLKRRITAEDVTFKSGVLAVSLDRLNQLAMTGEIKEEDGKRVLKIGGQKRYKAAAYVVHFVHTLDDGRKIRVTIVGNSTNGFTMAFKADNETVIDAEFKALSQSDGTLLILSEETETAA